MATKKKSTPKKAKAVETSPPKDPDEFVVEAKYRDPGMAHKCTCLTRDEAMAEVRNIVADMFPIKAVWVYVGDYYEIYDETGKRWPNDKFLGSVKVLQLMEEKLKSQE